MEGMIGATIEIIAMAVHFAMPATLGLAAAIAVASLPVPQSRTTESPEWANSPRVPVELTSFNPPA